VRFLIRSRLFTEAESKDMAPVQEGEEYLEQQTA
jgi:hypothetical protein